MYSYSDTGSSCPPGEAGQSWASFRAGVPVSHQDGTAHGGAHQEGALWGGVDCIAGMWDACDLSFVVWVICCFQQLKTNEAFIFIFPEELIEHMSAYVRYIDDKVQAWLVMILGVSVYGVSAMCHLCLCKNWHLAAMFEFHHLQ